MMPARALSLAIDLLLGGVLLALTTVIAREPYDSITHEVWLAVAGRRVTREGKPTGARLYDPKCSCGWHGRTDSKDKAQVEAMEHWRENR